MPLFQYDAMDSSGKRVRAELSVPNSVEAARRIRDLGYFPLHIREKNDPKKAVEPGKKKAGMGFAIGRVKNKQLCQFARQLSTLQDAGPAHPAVACALSSGSRRRAC